MQPFVHGVANIDDTHYILGSALGIIHSQKLSVTSKVSSVEKLNNSTASDRTRLLPDAPVACVGGGSMLSVLPSLVEDESVAMYS